jgi:hypothetical protein
MRPPRRGPGRPEAALAAGAVATTTAVSGRPAAGIASSMAATHLRIVGLLLTSGALAAGCGGSSSTTASVAGTTVSATVPGTTATLPDTSSIAQAATSAAAGASSAVSSVGDELRQRLRSSLPGLDAVIGEVEQEDDGTVTVHTSLGAGDPLATVAKNRCDAARQAIGTSASHLVILGSDGSTIASC